MGLFKNLNLAEETTIDWEMTPEYTFGTFESWGGKERIRSNRERVYYFFIDSWGHIPRLCLMERGIKHARVVAEIAAPPEMVRKCVDSHGKVALFERSFAINQQLKKWLKENIMDQDGGSMITLLKEKQEEILPDAGLPGKTDPSPPVRRVALPREPAKMIEEDVVELIGSWNFFDSERNPAGGFQNGFVDNGDGLTVSDRATGLMWQRDGLDIMSYRMMQKEIARLNRQGYAGHGDWRLPSMAEALSLLRADRNDRDQHLHPCFSARQPFIFVEATRVPGGYWFVDYKQGRAFWASGTIPGGFGRPCRTES